MKTSKKESSLHAAVREHEAALAAYALFLSSGDSELADAWVEDSFRGLWLALQQPSGREPAWEKSTDTKAWLFKACRGHALKGGKTGLAIPSPAGPAARDAQRTAPSILPLLDGNAEILRLWRKDGFSIRQITLITGANESQVKSLIQHTEADLGLSASNQESRQDSGDSSAATTGRPMNALAMLAPDRHYRLAQAVIMRDSLSRQRRRPWFPLLLAALPMCVFVILLWTLLPQKTPPFRQTAPSAGDDALQVNDAPLPERAVPDLTGSLTGSGDTGTPPTQPRPGGVYHLHPDSGHYDRLRGLLAAGVLPAPEQISLDAMMNSFTDLSPPALSRAPINLSTEIIAAPWSPHQSLLRIQVSRPPQSSGRKPVRLTFLLDASRSMADATKLPRLARVMRDLMERLTAADRITVVAYAGTHGIVLPSTPGDQHESILSVFAALAADPGAAKAAAPEAPALQTALAAARTQFAGNADNRIVLITDGDLKIAGSDDLTSLIRDGAADGITFSALGFSPSAADSELKALAEHGNGRFWPADSLENMRAALRAEVGDNDSGAPALPPAAAVNAKITVDFDSLAVSSVMQLGKQKGQTKINTRSVSGNAITEGERQFRLSTSLRPGQQVNAVFQFEPKTEAGTPPAAVQIAQITLEAFLAAESDGGAPGTQSGARVTTANVILPTSPATTNPGSAAERSHDDGTQEGRFAAAVLWLGMVLQSPDAFDATDASGEPKDTAGASDANLGEVRRLQQYAAALVQSSPEDPSRSDLLRAVEDALRLLTGRSEAVAKDGHADQRGTVRQPDNGLNADQEPSPAHSGSGPQP